MTFSLSVRDNVMVSRFLTELTIAYDPLGCRDALGHIKMHLSADYFNISRK